MAPADAPVEMLQLRVKRCSRPGCTVQIKPGQLACREHWHELPHRLREQLVDAWNARKANPDVPELVHVHRALLLRALKAWGIPDDEIARQMRARAPNAISTSCPMCGAPSPMHRIGCPRLG